MKSIHSQTANSYVITDATFSPGITSKVSLDEKVDLQIVNGVLKETWPVTERHKHHLDGFKVNVNGHCVLPAGVDAQVHLRVPGQYDKETARSGSQAAVAGGVGAFLTMPNTKPVIDEPYKLTRALDELEECRSQFGLTTLLTSAISKNLAGKEAVDFEGMLRSGATAFTDDGVGVMSDDLMKQAFRFSSYYQVPILQHAEMMGHGAVLAAGRTQRGLSLSEYSSQIETEMVERDLRLLEQFPRARYHVLHVSSKETLPLIARAKDRGFFVTCEVSPHHLFFNSDHIPENDTSFKMNPPLRSESDRLALVEALSSGLIDFMATDHAPHEPSMKTQNFKTAAFGTTGLETSLQSLFTLYRRGCLTWKRLLEVWSEAPARFLGVSDRFGHLKVGSPFHAVVLDTTQSGLVLHEDLCGKSKNSCFLGQEISGQVRFTLLGVHVHEMRNT